MMIPEVTPILDDAGDMQYKAIRREIEQGVNIIRDDEFKNQLLAISDITAEILVKTLGPYAHTTIIDDGQFTYPTKDGWLILNRLSFGDPVYNTILKFIKNISFNLVSRVGDGTTTANIVSNNFIKLINDKSSSSLKLGEYRQTEIVDALTRVKNEAVNRLNDPKILHTIDRNGNFDDIRRIAYISTNGNDEIADMIRDIYVDTRNPNIYVEITPDKETSIDVDVGYRLECKLLASAAYKNTDTGDWVNKEKTRIYIFDHNVTYADHALIIQHILSNANKANESVIVFAPYFDDILTNQLTLLIQGIMKKGQFPNSAFVQYPLSSKLDRGIRDDFALITDTAVITYAEVRTYMDMINKQNNPNGEETKSHFIDLSEGEAPIFTTPDELINSLYGYSTNITFTSKYCIVRDYDTESEEFKNNLKFVESEYLDAKAEADQQSNILSKRYMDASMRYVRLSGRMGTIHVGGESDLEKHCTKDAVDDAVLACKSAYNNGYVKGMNLATMTVLNNIIKDIIADGLSESIDYKVAVALLFVFSHTTLAIMSNKHNSTWVKNQYTANEVINKCINDNCGFNIITEQFEDEDNLTVINSVSTDIEILNAVISILSLILTSDQFLTINKHYDKKLNKAQILEEKSEYYSTIAKSIFDNNVIKIGFGDAISLTSASIGDVTTCPLDIQK